MEVSGGGRRRQLISREISPDQARLNYTQHHNQHHLHHHHHQQPLPQQQPQQSFMRPLREVQVIYYLSRNGQLEHPHFMELPYLPNRQLFLKDVTDRLTLLRGKGMPSLFSWSCKRSYKNGYVWNDLTENDIIYPADGVEYVLKGSEIIPGSSERYQRQHLPVSRTLPKSAPIHPLSRQLAEFDDDEEKVIDREVEDDVGEVAKGEQAKTHSCYPRGSRGVSTDELGRVKNRLATTRVVLLNPTELPLDDASPPSSSSSDKPPNAVTGGGTSGGSQRFEDGDPGSEMGRNSVLFQLISCGSAAGKGKAGGSGLLKAAASSAAAFVASPLGGGRRSSGGLHRGVVSRLASRAVEEDELRRVYENPRYGHPLVEDKEYFSGSIVEGSRGPPEPSLKKSSSYNEDRNSKLGIGETQLVMKEEREGEGRGGGVKAKCIPGRRKASVKQQAQAAQQQQEQLPKRGPPPQGINGS